MAETPSAQMSQPALWFTQPLDKMDLHVKHAAFMQIELTKVCMNRIKRIAQWLCVADKQRGRILYIFDFRYPHSLKNIKYSEPCVW